MGPVDPGGPTLARQAIWSVSYSVAMQLADFIEDLVDIGKRTDGLEARDCQARPALRSLPRYEPGETGPLTLVRDLKYVISELLGDDAARIYARLFFGLEQGSLSLGDREKVISERIDKGLRHIRGETRLEYLSEIAFHLYLLGTGSHPMQRHRSGMGYRVVSHNWSVIQFDNPPLREQYRFETVIEAVRPDVRFFVTGQSLYGSTIKDIWMESSGHAHIGYVPVDAGDPTGDVLHVVYLGRELELNTPETMILVVDTDAPETPKSSIEIKVVSQVENILLTATVPQELCNEYARIDYSSDDPYLERPKSTTIKRPPGGNLFYQIDDPQLGHLYSLEWVHASK
jgi:hypothetical protein